MIEIFLYFKYNIIDTIIIMILFYIQPEEEDGKQIALYAIRGNIKGFKENFTSDWENWEYIVEVHLPLKKIYTQDIGTVKPFSVSLSLHHVVALVKQDDILQYMLKHESSIEKWQKHITVDDDQLKVTFM